MAKVGNWTVETCATTGQGTLVLAGSDVGFTRFLNSVPQGPVWYSIEDGTNREAGMGTFNGSTQISRDKVYATIKDGVYDDDSPTPLNLTGNAIVACTFNEAAYNELLDHITDSTNPHNISAQQASYDPSSDKVSNKVTVQEAMIDHADSIEERVASMSGVVTGGVISQASANQINISDGSGAVFDSYTSPNNTSITNVNWLGLTSIIVTMIGNAGRTTILITAAGNILQITGDIAGVHYRENIILGIVHHINGSITDITNAPSIVKQTATDLYDLLLNQVSISGSAVKPVSEQLSIWIEAGLIFFPGSNWYTDNKNPNISTIPSIGSSSIPALFYPMTSDGVIGAQLTEIPQVYDDDGVLTNLTGNDATIHTLYNVGVNSREFILLYGQNLYNDLSEARDNLLIDRNTINYPAEVNQLLSLAEIGVSAGAIDLDDIDTTFIVNNSTLTSSSGGGVTNDHTTLINRDANDQHPVLSVTGLQDLLDGKMLWRNIWDGTTYELNDVVRDGSWTMVANKQTIDRPAPQPSGPPSNVYDGTLTPTSATAKTVIFGTRYSSAAVGWVNAYRIDVVEGQHYIVNYIQDPLGTPIVTQVSDFVASETKFLYVSINPFIIDSNSVFDIVATTNEPDGVPVSQAFNYDYSTPQNDVAPAAGEIIHANSNISVIHVHKTDNDSADNGLFLQGLTPGDIIDGAGVRWLIQSTTDNVTYMSFSVIPAAQGTPDGVQSFSFETVTATAIPYGIDTDYNLGILTVRGMFIADDDYVNITPDDNQYGVDIEVSPATISQDWDLLASAEVFSSLSEDKLDRVDGTAVNLLATGTFGTDAIQQNALSIVMKINAFTLQIGESDDALYYIRRPLHTGSSALCGGANTTAGANIELYGRDHASFADETVIRASAVDILRAILGLVTITGDLIASGAVNDSLGNTRSGRKNVFINGALNVWQRGDSITSSSNVYAADMFNINRGNASAGTVTMSRESPVPGDDDWNGGEVRNLARVTGTGLTGASSVNYRLVSIVEDVRTLSGKNVNLSFSVDNANAELTDIRIALYQGFGTGGSPSGDVNVFSTISIPSGRSHVSVTISLPSISGKTIGTDEDSHIRLEIHNRDVAVTEIDLLFSSFQIEEGTVATDYEYIPPAESLALCQRYYYSEESGRVFSAHPTVNSTSNITRDLNIDFPVTMRTSPSIISPTYNGGWSGTPSIQSISETGFAVNGTASSAGISSDLLTFAADASF